MNRFKLTLLTLILACLAIPGQIFSQCQGPFVSGNDCNANYLPTNSISSQFNLGGGYYFQLIDQFNEVYLLPGPGLKIFTEFTGNTYNSVAVLPGGTDVSALAPSDFTMGPLFMYSYNGGVHFGPWGQGTSGFIGVMTDDGRFGYVDFSNAGVQECIPNSYHFIINDLGISEVVQPGATTGVCATLLIDNGGAIPTMGQWGIMILLLILVIFGTQAVRTISRIEQSFN